MSNKYKSVKDIITLKVRNSLWHNSTAKIRKSLNAIASIDIVNKAYSAKPYIIENSIHRSQVDKQIQQNTLYNIV